MPKADEITKLEEKLAEEQNPYIRAEMEYELRQLKGEDTTLQVGMTDDEYAGEDAGEKPPFISPGDWPVVFKMPFNDTIISSKDQQEYPIIRFPFHIPAPGHTVPFTEQDDDVIAFMGKVPESSKVKRNFLKQILTATGVTVKDGKFNPTDIVGKTATVLYRVSKKGYTAFDPITGEPEQRQSTIANPRAVVALGSTAPQEAQPSNIPF